MKKNNKKNKGIVLITTMILLVVVVMISTMLAGSAYNGLTLSRSYSDSEQAQYAALSGLEYARSMVYQYSNWMQTPVNLQHSIGSNENVVNIAENKGIVRAVFEGEEENKTPKFSMAFLDTSSVTADLETNPQEYHNQVISLASEANIPEDIKYVSCNALAQTGDYCVLKRDASGAFKVYKTNLPANTMYIISQGTCNSTTRFAEAFIDVKEYTDFSTSSIARGDIDINLVGANPSVAVKAKTQEATSIRSYNNIDVNSFAKNNNCFTLENNGFVYAKNITVNEESVSATNGSKAEKYGINIDTSENSLQKTYNMLESGGESITFDSLATVAEGTTDSGAYIYVPNGTTGEWIFLENAEITGDSKGIISPNSTVTIPEKSASEVAHAGMNLMANGNVEITAPVVCDGNLFVGIAEKLNSTDTQYTLLTDKRPNIYFTGGSSSIQVGGKNSSDLILQGELKGKGKIFSNGNVYFQGGSFFDTEKNSGVSIYAENNVNLLKSTTTDYTIALGKVNTFLDSMWNQWAVEANATKYKDIESASKSLLSYEKNSETLKNMLNGLGCKTEQEQINFAKMLIQKNSAMVGGTIDSQIIDTPGFKGVNEETVFTTSQALISPTEQELLSYEPYNNNHSSNYEWETNNGTSISVNYKTGQYSKIKAENINNGIYYYMDRGSVSASEGFVEVWIHQNNSCGINDLIMNIPLSTSDPVTVRMGVNRTTVNTPNKSYYYEKEAAFSISSQLLPSSILQYNTEDRVLKMDIDKFFYFIKNQNYYEKTSSYTSILGIQVPRYEKIEDNENSTLNSMREALANLNTTKKAFSGKSNNIENFVINITEGSSSNTSLMRNIGYISGDEDTISGNFGNDKHLAIKDTLESDTFPNVNDTIVRGMIFTRKGNLDANSEYGTLTVVGGIVAYGEDSTGGSILINNCAGLNLCYDPDYMDFFYGRSVLTGYLYRVVF